MALSPTVFCNNILQRAFAENISVSPMKLQKLMYFVSCEYAKDLGTDLLSENFAVWQYGPVLPTVYNEFKSFGRNPITSYAKDATGESYAYTEIDCLREIIDKVWNSFKYKNGIELSNITHEDGSGWSVAFAGRRPTITTQEMRADNTYDKYMLARY